MSTNLLLAIGIVVATNLALLVCFFVVLRWINRPTRRRGE